jgi:hypothetical protein
MKVFILTSVTGLLAGWWIHIHLRQTLADSRAAAPSAAAPPARRGEPARAAVEAGIPESEIPARAAAVLKRCATGGADWETQLVPLWIRWARFAPEAALEHLEHAKSLLPSMDTMRVKDSLLAVWASHHSKEAAAWFRERILPAFPVFRVSSSNFQRDNFPGLMDTLALRDLTAAFSLTPSFFDRRSPKDMETNSAEIGRPVFYAAATAEENLPVFLQALRGMSREDVRGQLCADAMSYIVQAQMPNRREIVRQLPVPDHWPDGILNPWAITGFDDLREAADPETQADAYVAKVKVDDPGRGLVLEFIIDAWAERDPAAAGEWLMKWQGKPEGRLARAAYAREASKTDAVTAFEWANEFCEPRARAETAQKAYFQQRDRNPGEADEWLRSQDLPPALVSRLLGEGKSR